MKKEYIFRGYLRQPVEIYVIASDDDEAWDLAQEYADAKEWRETDNVRFVMDDDYECLGAYYVEQNHE